MRTRRNRSPAKPAAGSPTELPARRFVLGAMDLLTALLLLAGVWGGLPARWWPVDVGGTVLALLLGASGAALLAGTPWARKLAVVAGAVALATGMALVTALALTAAHVAGMYGPVGQGGAALLFTVAVLILPYLVAFPAAQLFVLARHPSSAPHDAQTAR